MRRAWWLAALSLATLMAACTSESPDDDTHPSASSTATPSQSPSPSEPAAGPPTGPPVVAADLSGTIAYSSDLDDGSADDVYVVRLDRGRGKPVRLTRGPEKEFDPALSPDGSLIAYRVNPRADSDEADIWVMAVDGSGKRNLTRSASDSNWAPAWTSDGRIVYSSMRATPGTLELWSMRPDGSERRRIAEGWCEYASPAPDGQSYVCAAAAGGHYDLIVVDESGERTELTSTPETEFGAAWSPDGEWIVFSRDLGDRWELLRIRPDGTAEQVVAPEGVFATWDPAGHIAWSGPGGINVANADGSGVTALDYPAQFVSWAQGGRVE